MNERMTELYAKACLDARDKHFEDKDVPAFIQCMAEKFAELIVRECANVAAEHDALDIYEEIREHFGIDSSDNIRAGVEIHSDRGYSESTRDEIRKSLQRRKDSRDNIRAGAEVHNDKGYSESTKEKYEAAKQRREDRREIKSSLGYSRVGMWGRK